MGLRSVARASHLGMGIALAASALGVGALAPTGPSGSWSGPVDEFVAPYDGCALVIPGEHGAPPSCAHEDNPPAGVDVTKPVSTSVLQARPGPQAAAVEAAHDAGVPVAANVATASTLVPCDGDGTSGSRVQAVYAVAAGATNRYASVVDQIKQWASGVDTVFKLSAAKTGGVRDVRFVTSDNGDGTCSPTVLNVTLPAGSFTSFGATI